MCTSSISFQSPSSKSARCRTFPAVDAVLGVNSGSLQMSSIKEGMCFPNWTTYSSVKTSQVIETPKSYPHLDLLWLIRIFRSNHPSQPDKPLSPPPGPTRTFTIDFEYPSEVEADDTFDTLRNVHANVVEELMPPNPNFLSEEYPATLWKESGVSTPAESTSHSHASLDSTVKPRFNIASAESLLKAFRDMLPYFACTALPYNATVSDMAKTQPFVLLAILASASASRTLQGHSLYDEEFRKVLGLKFVTRSERSLELLQGILIYCAW